MFLNNLCYFVFLKVLAVLLTSKASDQATKILENLLTKLDQEVSTKQFLSGVCFCRCIYSY